MNALIIVLAVVFVAACALWFWARRGFRKAWDMDVLVIGGGAAGLTAAGMAAHFGARTLLVEKAKLGGDCTWSGCVPSKALLSIAKDVHAARRVEHFGLELSNTSMDLRRVLEKVHEIQQEIYEHADSPEVLESRGVEVQQAQARFLDPHRVLLETKAGPSREVSFRWAVVCTGTRPVVPKVAGLAESKYLTNESIFHLKSLPKRLLVLGGGPIGCEMSQAFQRLGSQVTLVEMGPQILPKDEPELATTLTERLQSEGVDIRLNTQLAAVKQDDQGLSVELKSESSSSRLEVDQLLVSVGRAPITDGLDLQAAGVRCSNKGAISVDQHCRTSTPHIFATGDVAGGPMFTHWAEHSSKVAISNALLGVPMSLNPDALPWVTYTDPEVAHTGKTKRQLDDEGVHYQTYRLPFSKLDRAVSVRAPHGEIVVYAAGGKILGASAAGTSAGEIVSELGLAMQNGLPLRKVSDAMHAYPTFALGARQVADQWYLRSSPVRLLRLLGKLRGFRGTVSEQQRSKPEQAGSAVSESGA